jgi:hypothetical protein
MLKATFEFVGGPKDGRILHGRLGEGDDLDRYYLFSNRGAVGQRFKVASDYAVETLLREKLKVDSPHHFQPHYYCVTDRIEDMDEVWVRAEYVPQKPAEEMKK